MIIINLIGYSGCCDFFPLRKREKIYCFSAAINAVRQQPLVIGNFRTHLNFTLLRQPPAYD